MLCNRCSNELPSHTPVCPRCGPLTLGGGFGTGPIAPPAFVTSLASVPPGEPTAPLAVPAPPPVPLSTKQERKQRAREALAARARSEATGSAPSIDAPTAVDEAPLTAFTRPAALTLLAGFDLVLGCLELFVAWAAFQGRAGNGPGGSTTEVATYGGVGLLYVVAGLGLLGLRQYGRYAQLVLMLLAFVSGIGPAVAAILVIVYLMRPGVKVLLDDRDPRSLSAAERVRLVKDIPSPLLVPAAVAIQVLLAFVRLVPVLLAIAG